MNLPPAAWTRASSAHFPAARSAVFDAEDQGAPRARPRPERRRDPGSAWGVDLRHAAREPHRHRARVREAGGVHHLPRDRAPRLRFARGSHGKGRGHAGQGVGPGSHLAPFLPGEGRGGGPGHRDPEIHHQLRARRRSKEVKWTDTQDIAIALVDAHPDKDPKTVNFVDLYKWVLALPEFSDDPKRCGERILEAIQQSWIDEAE